MSEAIIDYKIREQNKWNLQMAKNNASVNFTRSNYRVSKYRDLDFDEALIQEILELYRIYKRVDLKLKDELPR